MVIRQHRHSDISVTTECADGLCLDFSAGGLIMARGLGNQNMKKYHMWNLSHQDISNKVITLLCIGFSGCNCVLFSSVLAAVDEMVCCSVLYWL